MIFWCWRPHEEELVRKSSSRRSVASYLARLLLVFAVPGCGLILDPDPPEPSPRGSEAERLECFVTVQSGDMQVALSSITHEDFGARRDYFTCVSPHCPTTCSRRTEADAEADWSRWVRREIERIQTTDPTSTFSMVDEGWCQVPGTLRCEPLGTLLTDLTCDDLPPLDPLEVCPPPVGDACVEVSCPDPGCSEIDFGAVPISDTPLSGGVSQTVVVSNCGEVDVRTQIDETILPVGARSHFVIPVDTFQCGARTAEEMMLGRILEVPPGDSDCSFDIVFRPTMPLDHAGRKVFWSEALSDHTIELRGFGVGGGLIDDAPAMICLPEATPCTAEQTITLTNGGPGPVIVRTIATSATNFEIVTPTPAMLPITLNAGDPPLEVRVRWCAGPPGAVAGTLQIDTSARRIEVGLETLPSCP